MWLCNDRSVPLLGVLHDDFGEDECMTASLLDLSLVLACYNEELVIEDSVARIIEVLDNTRYCHEIIFVDDCATPACGS